MTLKLHHLEMSRSRRIVWLLAELDVPHEIVHHKRNPQTRLAPPELLDIHPMGKSPLLEDDSVVIAETGAIAQYLLARHDPGHRLHPTAESPDFPRYLEWMHAAEGAIFLPGLMGFYLSNVGLGDHMLAKMMAQEAAKASACIEQHLARHDYFAGAQFSAADCLMGFQIENAVLRGGDVPPATQAWLDRVSARPAYAKMQATGL